MKPLSFLTRAMGQPVIAVLLCGWFLKAMFLQHAAAPEIIVPACFAFAALRSWRKVRNHRAWLRQWNSAGDVSPASDGSERRSDRNGSKAGVLLLLLPVFLLPLAAQNIPHDAPVMPVLGLLWLGSVGWSAFALLRRFRKPKAAPVSRVPETDAPDFVSWVAEPAASSPSRDEITAELPDYVLAAMLSNSGARSKQAPADEMRNCGDAL